jgi:hypothetical protein
MDNWLNLMADKSGDAARFLFMWSWKSLFLLGPVWLSVKLFRFRTPAVRYQFWLVGLIAVAVLPLLSLGSRFLSIPESPSPAITYVVEMPAGIAPLARPTLTASAETSPDFQARLLSRVLGSYLELCRGRATARAVSASELGCAEIELAGFESIEIKLSPAIRSPLLAGFIRPAVLLPHNIMEWSTAEERVSILRHEIAHAQRRDFHITYFQALLGAVFFFHPLVRYVCHQLSVEREMACDCGVLDLGTPASTYAASILKIAERNISADPLYQPAAFASKKTLERRINMILSKRRLPSSSRRWPFLTLAIALIAVAVWIVVPGRPAGAGQIQDQISQRSRSGGMANRSKGTWIRESLFKALGDAKDFDKLIDIALTDSDADLRHRAVQRLTELEGDGSTAALIELYSRSEDIQVKKTMLEALGERNDYGALSSIARSEPDPQLCGVALEQLSRIEKTSDSRDR